MARFLLQFFRMKKLLSILFVALLAGTMNAQESADRPQRTPEEEALKQTVRLTRELNISDSARFDTLYHMHLKYARIRQKGLTRAENLQRMQAIHEELKVLLTPEEFERFMNHPAENPHRPHGKQLLVPATQPQRRDSL